MREERQREQQEGEAERGFRPGVDHAIRHGQRCREGNVRATHGDASDHQSARHEHSLLTHRGTWTYSTISPESPARRLEPLPNLLEDRVAPFEIGRQEIGGGVGVPGGAYNEAILLKEIQVMSDRAVIELERRAELVCLASPFAPAPG